MDTAIVKMACDLNEHADNRYALILNISETAKILLDEATQRANDDPFYSSSVSTNKVIYQALIMKFSEMDIGSDLIG